MRHATWRGWVFCLLLAATLAACGGGGGGGDPEVTFRPAAAGDLANRSFAFGPGFFDDEAPRNTHASTLTLGSFQGATAGFFLRDDVDGSLVGGTLTLGSCVARVAFVALAGEETVYLDPADPLATTVFDPCEVGSDGTLRLTDELNVAFTSSPGAAAGGVVADFTVPLSTAFEVDAPAALYETRSETGTARLTLFNSDVLLYTLAVDGLATGDVLTVAHIHSGDAISNGPPVITLAGAPLQPTRPVNPVFAQGASSLGAAILLTDAEVANLLDPANAFYVNIHSQDFGSGLVRGQVGETIVLAFNTAMTTDAERAAPANQAHLDALLGRTETGFAQFRLLDDDRLGFKLQVDGLAAGDALTASHIHSGGSTATGPVAVTLVADFAGTVAASGFVDLTPTQAADLLDPGQAFYVNVHSVQLGPGLVRGQLRDVVSFAAQIQPILTARCAVPSCHGTPLGAPMSLAAGNAYGNLVPARVQAGDPEQSLLYQRITSSTFRMPPAPAPALAAGDQDLIRQWILQGAQNN